jgi:hypothetical protein
LVRLKENVIIGRLIPARYQPGTVTPSLEAGEEIEDTLGEVSDFLESGELPDLGQTD